MTVKELEKRIEVLELELKYLKLNVPVQYVPVYVEKPHYWPYQPTITCTTGTTGCNTSG